MGKEKLKKLIQKIDETKAYKEWNGKSATEYFRIFRKNLDKEVKGKA